MKNIKLSLIFIFVLTACNSLDEAGKVLKNEKVRTTDEFLVKKRDPLILPPDYKDIPLPGSKNIKKKSSEKDIKKILNAPDEQTVLNNQTSSTEKSIINQIRK